MGRYMKEWTNGKINGINERMGELVYESTNEWMIGSNNQWGE